MKKIVSSLIVLCVMLSFSLNSETVSANTLTTVTIDGGKNINNRTLVPLRSIFEQLGAGVQYNAKDKTITAQKGTITVWLKVGSKTVKVNNKSMTIDVPAQVYNGSTYVPLRFIGDAFGVTTDWDAKAETAIVTSATKKIIVNVGEFDKAFAKKSVVLKTSPGEIYGAVGVIPVGASVKVTGGVPTGYDQDDWISADMYGWSKVKYDGKVGWVPTHDLAFENPYNWAPGIKDKVIKEITSLYVDKTDQYRLVQSGSYDSVGFYELQVQINGTGQWYYVVTINAKTGWWHG